MMGLMTGKPRRTLALLTSLLLFGPLPLPLLLAQGQGPQRVPVPIPPPTKRSAQEKKDRGALPPIPTFRDVAKEVRSEEHTSELQSHSDLVCRLLLEKKKLNNRIIINTINIIIQQYSSPMYH